MMAEDPLLRDGRLYQLVRRYDVRVRGETLPSLPYDEWAATRDTLHLWLQIVGKIKLACMPPRNHWWHVTFHPGLRGLTTGRIPFDATRRFEIAFDLIEHFLAVTTESGAEERLDLRDGMSVAAFDSELHAMLGRLGLDVAILETPYGVPMKTGFQQDKEHCSYDGDAVTRYWRVLDWSAGVFEEFNGLFCGKTSPVQLFWHSLDLSVARYSGARAPAMEDADPVTREAYSHEVIAFGFWAGDEQLHEPSYYSYTSPEPDGLRSTKLSSPARWIERNGGSLAVLAYDAVRDSPDPRSALRDFLQSAYLAGADSAGWDVAAFESSWYSNSSERTLA